MPPETLQVLVVDDNRDVADSLKRMLEAREEVRFVVYVAYSLAETVNKLASADIEAVLLDMHLPDAPAGPELITIIKALEPDLRVIVVTGWDVDQGTEAQVKAAGADEVVIKPADPSDLVRKLRYSIAYARSEKHKAEMDAVLSKFGRAMEDAVKATGDSGQFRFPPPPPG